jgi:hypothetical protein
MRNEGGRGKGEGRAGVFVGFLPFAAGIGAIVFWPRSGPRPKTRLNKAFSVGIMIVAQDSPWEGRFALNSRFRRRKIMCRKKFELVSWGRIWGYFGGISGN